VIEEVDFNALNICGSQALKDVSDLALCLLSILAFKVVNLASEQAVAETVLQGRKRLTFANAFENLKDINLPHPL